MWTLDSRLTRVSVARMRRPADTARSAPHRQQQLSYSTPTKFNLCQWKIFVR